MQGGKGTFRLPHLGALAAGVSLEMIAKLTGLDQAAILKLKERQG